MSQVFNNLLINAVHAMPTGGTVRIEAAKVKLAAEEVPPLPAGRYIRISVADEGTGIPPEHLDSIFEPYFTTKQKGCGLGLATCFSIIRNHGGHIAVRSQLRQGSIFTIHLPVSDQERPVDESPQSTEAITGRGRILVMDDEEAVGKVAIRLLTHLGYEAVLVADGAAAIAKYHQARDFGKPFDAVLMDLTVPGGMADYRRYGFAEVITKPYEIETLGRTLNKVLSRRE